METAICLHNVTKKYEGFTLDHISMEIPRGSIVGLVGENGAGKTTLLKCILQIINTDEGAVYVEGKEVNTLPGDWKKDVGVILTGVDFAGVLNAKEMGISMKNIYSNWQQDVYENYLRTFKIDSKKKIAEYSKGMKMKLNLALALSHGAKTLIFDEATSGLDPVVRDDILDILLDFIQDENHTVLLSSHITSDLEKVADYIAFIHEGRLQFFMNKDEILYRYGVVRCSGDDVQKLPEELVESIRKNSYGYEVLVSEKETIQQRFPNLIVDKVNIEEVILFMVKGERK